MSIIPAHTSTTGRTPRRGVQRGARPPYAVGDHVRTLFNGGRDGTCVALAAPVVQVRRDDTRPEYPWHVVAEVRPGQTVDAHVNARGVDRSQYVEPSVTTMTVWDLLDPAAALAVELAAQLRRAGVVGPLARRTPDALHVVDVPWPSRRPRVHVVVEAHNGTGTFTIRTYPDVDAADPAITRETYTVPHALGVLLPALL